MAVAPRNNAALDQNWNPTLTGVSTADGFTPVAVEVDPLTGALQVAGIAGGSSNPNGQATMANSSPVVVASDQSNLPTNTKQLNGVTVSVGNGVTDTGTQRVSISSDSTGLVKLAANTGVDIGKLTANQSVNVSQINAVAPLMGNGVTGTGSQRVTIASDNTAFSVNLGTGGVAATSLGKAEDAVHASGDTGVAMWGVRNDAAAVGTSASGDYGYMRLDQYNQQAVIPGVSGTETITRVASAAVSTSLLASNTSRKGASFYNESTAIAYLKRGATASATSYTIQIAPGGYYELPAPIYQGAIDCIWASANGAMMITEVI